MNGLYYKSRKVGFTPTRGGPYSTSKLGHISNAIDPARILPDDGESPFATDLRRFWEIEATYRQREGQRSDLDQISRLCEFNAFKEAKKTLLAKVSQCPGYTGWWADPTDYKFDHVGQSYQYDVPFGTRGRLAPFQGIRVRLLCLGGSPGRRWVVGGPVNPLALGKLRQTAETDAATRSLDKTNDEVIGTIVRRRSTGGGAPGGYMLGRIPHFVERLKSYDNWYHFTTGRHASPAHLAKVANAMLAIKHFDGQEPIGPKPWVFDIDFADIRQSVEVVRPVVLQTLFAREESTMADTWTEYLRARWLMAVSIWASLAAR